MKDTKIETEISFSGNTKAKEKDEEKQETKETKETVKKEIVSDVKNISSMPKESASSVKKEEKSIDKMTDAEIEAYLKKRKAEKASFTIVNEDVPMHKLIRASVPPQTDMNKEEILRTVMFRQNKLERDIRKKV